MVVTKAAQHAQLNGWNELGSDDESAMDVIDIRRSERIQVEIQE
ncbi:hypothetical protein [Mycobacterium paragordonae]